MDFWLTDEQRIFRESTSRFLAEHHSIRKRLRAPRPGGGGEFADADWKAFAELGWLAAPFPEASGGIGGTTAEMALVMEQLGRVLLPCPYLSSVALSGTLLLRGGQGSAQRF